ncbi:hypothetical protein AAMO2058_001113600 [Amorphochlora amoebiformis]
MKFYARALLFSVAVNLLMVGCMVALLSSSNVGAPMGITSGRVGRVVSSRSALRSLSGGRSTAVSARKFFVGGNWKANGDMNTITELINGLNQGAPTDGNVEVVCAPPFPYLQYARGNLRNDFSISAQDCWVGGAGAFTGEVCPEMLRDIGCEWVILGHSERRHLPQIKETDEVIADKTKYALDKGLGVILCIGELLEEREAGQTLQVCERQMAAVAKKLNSWDKVVIAYEPVWAIGTGKVATPEQAQEVHDAVRNWMARNVGPEVANQIRILYGGSVNPENCDELATKPDIDGFLVGGASLKPDFLKIVDSYKMSAVPAN